MKKRDLRRVVGHVVLAAMPTLALTTACRTTGEATYVVRSNGRSCHDACASLTGSGDTGSWRVASVMDCVDATEVVSSDTSGVETRATSDAPVASEAPEPRPLSTPVAVCRMQTRYMGGIGRRPEGLRVHDAEGRTEAGAFFARMEQLERAAVIAFARTESVLRSHGAPSHLVRDVMRARREEETHVAIAARWRAHLGGAFAVIEVPTHASRDLASLARENATEGCVHETWGAVLAEAHARGAALHDRAMARDLAHVAADEASHAALSHRLDAWLRGVVVCDAPLLDHARRDAIEEVRASLDDEHEALASIGFPSRATRARLFDVAASRFGWLARSAA